MTGVYKARVSEIYMLIMDSTSKVEIETQFGLNEAIRNQSTVYPHKVKDLLDFCLDWGGSEGSFLD